MYQSYPFKPNARKKRKEAKYEKKKKTNKSFSHTPF